MIIDRRTTRLVNETFAGHTAEQVDIFSAAENESKWVCPFCDSDSPYQLPVPPVTKQRKLSKIKILIKEHIQLHQKNIVEELIKKNSFTSYKKEKEEVSQTTRSWIDATIQLRGLYQHMDSY